MFCQLLPTQNSLKPILSQSALRNSANVLVFIDEDVSVPPARVLSGADCLGGLNDHVIVVD